MKSEKKNELKAVDFFCGAGGMTYGMSLAGIKVLAGIDNDPDVKKLVLQTIRKVNILKKIYIAIL